MTVLLVALGGAIGSVLRDLAGRWRGPVAGTDLVNRVGSVLLGTVVGAVEAGALGPDALALLGVGVAGGMTTFSTWMVQLVDPPPGSDSPWWRLVRETLLGIVLAGVAVWVTGRVFS